MNFHKFFDIVDDPDIFVFRGRNLFNLFNLMSYMKEWRQHRTAKPEPPRNITWLVGRVGAFFRALGTIVWLSVLVRRNQQRFLMYGGWRHLVIRGQAYSYNSRLVDQVGREQIILVYDSDDGVDKIYRPDFFIHDFALLIAIFYLVSRTYLGRDLKKYAHRIVTHYPDLDLSESAVVRQVAMFYAKYLLHRCLLVFLKPKKVFLTAYYGKEDFIAACRDNQIEVVELMHGLLTSHPFYNYPKSFSYLFKQAPFPDKLGVYGNYWKQLVIEQGNMFPPSSVFTVGYYLRIPETPERTAPPNKKVIFISGGALAQQDIINYALFLKSKLNRQEWYIFIKPHPIEDGTRYQMITERGFLELTNQDAYSLLAQANVHISVLSTLLYEAIRYDVANYLLLIQDAPKVCFEILESGVALPLKYDELPDPSQKPKVTPNLFFSEFDPVPLFSEVR